VHVTPHNTWTQFKVDFSTAQREFRLTKQTAQHSGFHSADMMTDKKCEEALTWTADAISRLAISTVSDRWTEVTLNGQLQSHNSTQRSHAYIKKLNEDITYLNAKMKPAW
jgi:hypothetical protein